MKVNRKKLVAKLEQAYSTVGYNSLLPEFQTFRIHHTILTATDGAMKYWSQLDEDLGISCCVVAEGFLQLLRGLDDEEVEFLEDQDKTKLVIRTGKIRGQFATTPHIEIPVPQICCFNGDRTIGEEQIQSLLHGLRFCSTGVSKDETSGLFCGVILDKDKMYSSDRYRVYRVQHKSPFAALLSIPPRFIEIMSKNASEIIDLGNIGNTVYIHLKDGTIITSVVFSGQMQDLDTFFPTDQDPQCTIEIDDKFSSVIDRHTAFLKSLNAVDKEIEISIETEHLVVHSHNPQLGDLVEELPGTNNLGGWTTVKFFINPLFFTDIGLGTNTFKFYPERGLVLLENGDMKYLVNTRSE